MSDTTAALPTPDASGHDSPTALQASDSARRRDTAAEAARYRLRLREVEAERDDLAQRLTAERRGSIEYLLTAPAESRHREGKSVIPALHRPEDLWDVLNAQPDQFYDEDGRLDRDALADHISAVTETRPYLLRPERRPSISATALAGLTNPKAHLGGPAGSAWGDALKD